MNSDRAKKFARLLDESYDEFSRNQGALYVKWDLEGCKRWELIPEAGMIAFVKADGTFVVADIQIIGTYIPAEGLWQWAWSHANLDDALKVDALVVRDYGVEKRLDPLRSGSFEADAMLVGGLTALTVKLTGSEGVWEGIDEGIRVMIAMRNIRAAAELP